MGNRANVVFVAGTQISPTIYLHWNGGPESVYPFLAELDRRGVRADGEYEAARFCQVVGDFFDTSERGGLSLGVITGPKAITPEALSHVPTDIGDNGFYVVDRTTDPLKMRRFEGRYTAGVFGLAEMSPEEVERERRDAFTSAYREAIAEFFVNLDAKRYAKPADDGGKDYKAAENYARLMMGDDRSLLTAACQLAAAKYNVGLGPLIDRVNGGSL